MPKTVVETDWISHNLRIIGSVEELEATLVRKEWKSQRMIKLALRRMFETEIRDGSQEFGLQEEISAGDKLR
jgi:hypothetical protein